MNEVLKYNYLLSKLILDPPNIIFINIRYHDMRDRLKNVLTI